MTLRARLIFLNVTVLAVLLVLMGVALRARVYVRLEAGIDRELSQRGRFFPRRRAIVARDRRMGPPLFRADGTPLQGFHFARDPAAIRQALETNQSILSTVNGYRVYSLPLGTNEGEAVYQTSESLEPVYNEVDSLTRELLTLVPLGLLAAGVAGLFLTNRALRPIQQLQAAAATIQATGLSQRLTVRGKDELGQLSATFNAMLGRLETAFEHQRQFVADASHELKTPLTTIKAAAEIGRSDPDASPKSALLFGRIEEATDRTVHLVQNLLLLARSDGGALALQPEVLPLQELVEAVYGDLSALPPEANPNRVVVATPEATLWGDPALLFLLLRNLIENALRHTPPEGKVTISATEQTLVVADTGTGIPAEHLPFLTQRFYRVDSARARRDGGTGLGLAICRSIAEAHGGALMVKSTVGVGTQVSVALGPRYNAL